MNILILLKKIPYPLHDGASIRSFHVIKNLSKAHNLYILAISRSEDDIKYIDDLKPYCKQIKLVKLDNHFFIKAINSIKSLVFRKPYTVLANTHPQLKSELKKMFDRNKIDFIQIEELYLAENVPQNLLAVSTYHAFNVEYEILQKLSQVTTNLKKIYYKFQSQITKTYETIISKKALHIFCVSVSDKNFFNSITDSVTLIPNCVEKVVEPCNVQKKNQLLMTGLLSYPPNLDGMIYFFKEVIPYFKNEIPHIIVVSKNPPYSLTSLTSSEHVTFLKNEDSIERHMLESIALLVPLRSGGGTKLKILEALSYGLPTITTSVGAQGLDVEDGLHILIGNTAETFYQKVNYIIESEDLRNKLSHFGRELITEKYLWNKNIKQMSDFYSNVSAKSL